MKAKLIWLKMLRRFYERRLDGPYKTIHSVKLDRIIEKIEEMEGK